MHTLSGYRLTILTNIYTHHHSQMNLRNIKLSKRRQTQKTRLCNSISDYFNTWFGKSSISYRSNYKWFITWRISGILAGLFSKNKQSFGMIRWTISDSMYVPWNLPQYHSFQSCNERMVRPRSLKNPQVYFKCLSLEPSQHILYTITENSFLSLL